jgi:hypothetical protein
MWTHEMSHFKIAAINLGLILVPVLINQYVINKVNKLWLKVIILHDMILLTI